MTNGTKFPWDIMLLAALGLYFSTFMLSFAALPDTLGDTDNAMRLVQLRDYLQHGKWYDLHTDRLSPGAGYTSHWSRLPDLIMALLYWAVLPVSPVETAEWAVRAFYPGLWILPALVAISWFAFKLTGNRLAVIATLIIVALCATATVQFVAGRIDHHNAQIALSVICVVAAAFIQRDWRYGVVSGLSGALLLTIGLEALPFVVVAAVVIAIRYVFLSKESAGTRAFVLSLGVATLAGLAISLPPARWMETACDAIAFNFATPIAAGCLVMLVWAASQKLSASMVSRAAGVGLAGVLAAALFAVLDPACLRGPFGHVNPLVKPLWLDQVQEMQPLFTRGNADGNISNLLFIYPAVMAAMGSLWLLRKAEFRRSMPFLTMLAAFLVSLVLGLINLRMAAYIPWFASPLICVALFKFCETLGQRKALFAVPLFLALSPFAMEFWLTPVIKGLFASSNTITSAAIDCSTTKNFSTLAKLPKGLIMAELDMGSYLLANTPHSVVAAPYHRISDSILQDIRFFTSDSVQQARDVALKGNINYVLICNDSTTSQAANNASNLALDLRSGKVPAWLTTIPLEPGNPLQIYAVKDD